MRFNSTNQLPFSHSSRLHVLNQKTLFSAMRLIFMVLCLISQILDWTRLLWNGTRWLEMTLIIPSFFTFLASTAGQNVHLISQQLRLTGSAFKPDDVSIDICLTWRPVPQKLAGVRGVTADSQIKSNLLQSSGGKICITMDVWQIFSIFTCLNARVGVWHLLYPQLPSSNFSDAFHTMVSYSTLDKYMNP